MFRGLRDFIIRIRSQGQRPLQSCNRTVVLLTMHITCIIRFENRDHAKNALPFRLLLLVKIQPFYNEKIPKYQHGGRYTRSMLLVRSHAC